MIDLQIVGVWDPLASIRAELEAVRVELAGLRATQNVGDDQLLNADQAAALIGSTAVAIRAMARRGTLPVTRIGRRLRFRRSDLARL